MIIKNNNLEQEKARLRELAGIKPMNESKSTRFDLLLTESALNGTKYAIVKEDTHFYIKTTDKAVVNESTLDYIGGLKNKADNKYRYRSFADASKNLNFMMITINERLEKDMEAEQPPLAPGEESAAPSPMPEPSGAPAPAPSPAPSGSSELAPDAMPEPAPSDAPAPEGMPAPQGDDAESGINMDDDSDLDDDGDGENIDHFVGKLTSAIREKGPEEMSEDKIKSILNSVISSLPLQNMSPEERLVIARVIKKGGKSGDSKPAPEPAPEENDGAMDEGKHMTINHDGMDQGSSSTQRSLKIPDSFKDRKPQQAPDGYVAPEVEYGEDGFEKPEHWTKGSIDMDEAQRLKINPEIQYSIDNPKHGQTGLPPDPSPEAWTKGSSAPKDCPTCPSVGDEEPIDEIFGWSQKEKDSKENNILLQRCIDEIKQWNIYTLARLWYSEDQTVKELVKYGVLLTKHDLKATAEILPELFVQEGGVSVMVDVHGEASRAVVPRQWYFMHPYFAEGRQEEGKQLVIAKVKEKLGIQDKKAQGLKEDEIEGTRTLNLENDDLLIDKFLGMAMDDAEGTSLTDNGFKFKSATFIVKGSSEDGGVNIEASTPQSTQMFKISKEFYNDTFKGFIQTLHGKDETMDEGLFDMFKKGNSPEQQEDDKVITDFFNKIQRGEVRKNEDGTYTYKSAFISIEKVSNVCKVYIQSLYPTTIPKAFRVSAHVLNDVVLPALNGQEQGQ